jgi:hypothetical protein
MRDIRKSVVAVFAAISLASMAGIPSDAASAQEQQPPPSLGEIARMLRAQKKAPSTGKIWTNENIPRDPFAISVVGPPLPPPEEPANTTAKPAPAAHTGKTLAEVTAELAQAQQELELREKELDIMKRDFVLQQQGFYTNPMASQDVQGQAQLATAQKGIDAKQAEVDQTKAHIVELQQKAEELKKGSPPPATSPGKTVPQN